MTALEDRPVPKMCRAGLHELPAKGPCRVCMKINADLHNQYWQRLARSVAAPVHITDYAACDSSNAHLFDPIDTDERAKTLAGGGHQDDPDALPRIQRAKAICMTCPAVIWCYAEAVEHGLVGVFGGTYFGRRT